MTTSAKVLHVLACAALCTQVAPAVSQTGSTRPITVLVPAATGGGHDFTARVIADKLGQQLGQQVVVDNRGGASGSIAGEMAAKSAPDGRTILLSTPSAAVINPYLQKGMRYEPMKDLAPVTLAGITPLVIVAHPSVPAKSLGDVIRLAKAQPGQLVYGTPGPSSSQFIAGAWITSLVKIDMIHAPYKGAGPVTIDVLGGQIPFGIVGMAPVLTHIKAGKLRAVAVLTKKRVSWLPDVQTVSESPGLKDVEVSHWMGVQVSAKTPADVIKRLNKEVVEILRMPDVRDKLMAQGIEPVGNTEQEFAVFLASENKKYAYLVPLSGATE